MRKLLISVSRSIILLHLVTKLARSLLAQRMGGTYELHPLPEYFTEPSVLRNDSTADITVKDLVPEQSLPVLEDVHLKSCIAIATSTGVVVPAICYNEVGRR